MRLAGPTLRLTRLYQRMPNQPPIPTRVLDVNSSTDDGGDWSGGEADDDESDDAQMMMKSR
jgi:hypothetical protein